MADDERRAEIEAVARALAVDSGWCYSPSFYRGLAEVAVDALNCVRDARGDEWAEERALRAIADTSRWDVPTEDRDEDARAAIAAMRSEGVRLVRDARGDDLREIAWAMLEAAHYAPDAHARLERATQALREGLDE